MPRWTSKKAPSHTPLPEMKPQSRPKLQDILITEEEFAAAEDGDSDRELQRLRQPQTSTPLGPLTSSNKTFALRSSSPDPEKANGSDAENVPENLMGRARPSKADRKRKQPASKTVSRFPEPPKGQSDLPADKSPRSKNDAAEKAIVANRELDGDKKVAKTISSKRGPFARSRVAKIRPLTWEKLAPPRDSTAKPPQTANDQSQRQSSVRTQARPAVLQDSSELAESDEEASRSQNVAEPSSGAGKSGPKRRYRPGQKALLEIRKLQGSYNLLIPKASFARLVRQICQEQTFATYYWQVDALSALHESAEAYLIGLMEDSYLIALHAKRKTLMKKDMSLARRIRGGLF